MDQFSSDVTSTPEVRYAGFRLRFLAFWVDFLIFLPVGILIQQMLGNDPFAVFDAQSMSDLEKMQGSATYSIGMLVSFAISIAYSLIFWVNYDGATPGKKLLGIKIIKTNGENITYPVAFIRWLGNLISAATVMFFSIGYLWVIWDKKKQAWHDKIAGTIVVRTDKKPRTILAVFITLLSFFIFTIYFGAIIVKGASLGIKESNSIKNQQGVEIVNGDNALTQVQADKLATEVFLKLNETRKESNLEELGEDQQLCAYTQRRLDQLLALGKHDDGRGFYEDTANPEIARAYFINYLNLGTVLYNLNPNVATTADDVISNWSTISDSSAMSKIFNNACVRANPKFVILIAGQHK